MTSIGAIWTTRTESAADVAAVRAITVAAFETAAEADLVDALRTDPAWIEGLSLVAVDDEDRPVAHALMTRCHVDDAPALALAPCSVLPAHQRTGAGSAVIRAALAAASVLGEQYVIVLGHPEYYPRFAFTPASTHGIGLSIEVPDEALMALSLDGTALPGGTVRYAAPFGI